MSDRIFFLSDMSGVLSLYSIAKNRFPIHSCPGHDVLRFKNKVHCYNTITEFFRENLGD